MSWLPAFLAHAAPISYRFPLPIWVYAVGAGAAVLASAPAAAVAVHEERGPGRRSADFYRYLRPLRLGAITTGLLGLLLVWGLVGGLGASTVEGGEFFENPITVLVWVDFWVGLGLVAFLVGDVWDLVSPLSAAARAIDRGLARREVAPFAYPERLGRWPAVALLLVFSWLELVWDRAKEPRTLALLVLAYLLATLVGSAAFGARAWLGNCELFTVFSRTFAAVAPLDLGVPPDDWLELPREQRQLRLRGYCAGLRDLVLPPGGPAFVVGLLGTVVYDGFSQTNRFARIESWVLERSTWLGYHTDVLATLLGTITVALFALAFLLVCALVRGRHGTVETARLVAPTLIPIAAAYFAAHYFTYLLIAGQATLGVLVDPFGHSWNPWGLGEYPLRKGIAPAVVIWWVQVALIVAGHVAGVVAAHRVALRERLAPRSALLAQAPLVLLMVAYTVAGLWVLAQQISATS